MANIKYSAVFILFIAILSITGCKKDDEEPAAPTKTDLITAQSWKLKQPGGVLILGQTTSDPTILALLGALGNSSVKFEKEGNYVATDNSNNSVTRGKWEFSADETQLIIDKGTNEEYTLKIELVDANNLDLSTQQTVTGVPLPIRVDIFLVPA